MGWTEQQIQTLRQMWGHGFSATDIARSLGGGKTRNSVIGKAHRLKLSVGAPLSGRSAGGGAGSYAPPLASSVRMASKKRAMLRPLPVPPKAEVEVKPVIRHQEMRPAEVARRAEGIAVTKAGERHCRWPIGDPRSPEFRFCGCSTYEGLPYCVDHARVAYQTVSRRSRVTEMDSPPEFRFPNVARY